MAVLQWTDEELDAIRELYPLGRRMELYRKVRKSWRDIQRKAKKLGLSWPGRFDPKTGQMHGENRIA